MSRRRILAKLVRRRASAFQRLVARVSTSPEEARRAIDAALREAEELQDGPPGDATDHVLARGRRLIRQTYDALRGGSGLVVPLGALRWRARTRLQRAPGAGAVPAVGNLALETIGALAAVAVVGGAWLASPPAPADRVAPFESVTRARAAFASAPEAPRLPDAASPPKQLAASFSSRSVADAGPNLAGASRVGERDNVFELRRRASVTVGGEEYVVVEGRVAWFSCGPERLKRTACAIARRAAAAG